MEKRFFFKVEASWLNLPLMSSTPSICFYKIIPHRIPSKFGVEHSDVNSCSCYTNRKREKNEQNTTHNAELLIYCRREIMLIFIFPPELSV